MSVRFAALVGLRLFGFRRVVWFWGWVLICSRSHFFVNFPLNPKPYTLNPKPTIAGSVLHRQGELRSLEAQCRSSKLEVKKVCVGLL